MPDGIEFPPAGQDVAACLLSEADLDALRASGLFDPDYYTAAYPEARLKGGDPLAHFCAVGVWAGWRPNPYFDPAWYLARNPDVQRAGCNPLLHYIQAGEDEGRRPVAWFDPAWYRGAHGVPAGEPCLRHFLERRHSGTVSPIPEFDPAFYLARNPDVAAAGIDPFEHYLHQGHREGRDPSAYFDGAAWRRDHMGGDPEENPLLHCLRTQGAVPRADASGGIAAAVRRHAAPGPWFEERQALPEGAVPEAKLLAYYLPQFHAIPENDAWWGRGFTEWANVARGVPRFEGHYQPRIPRDLGYYTLGGTEVLRRQARMAREAGIHGFVFYFYRFMAAELVEIYAQKQRLTARKVT